MPAKKIQEIDRILRTKNLKPLERAIFLRRRKRLVAAIRRQAKDDLKMNLKIEADKKMERNSPGIVGESLSNRKFQGIRRFHPNINPIDPQIRIRPPVKKHLSKI